MFRSTKRKKRPTGRAFRNDDDDDDDEEDAPAVVKVKPVRKAVRPSVVGGGSKSKKAGGRSKLVFKNQSSTIADDVVDEEETGKKEASAYSKDALAQLMAEQNTKKSTTTTAKEPKDEKDTTRVKFAALDISMKYDPEEEETSGEDFIALDGTTSSTGNNNTAQVLAGDEAMRQSEAVPGSLGGLLPRDDFMEDKDEEEERMMHQHQEVEDDGWEARIAHRAGITTAPTRRSTSSNINNNATLDSIRDSVSRSLRQNQAQQQEIADRIRRRQNELSQETVLQHHQTQLTEAGQQLDYYQQLQNRLCAWVGAMQEVQPRIQAVLYDGLCKLQREWAKVDAQVEWEQEVVLAILQEHGLVEQVIGKGGQQQKIPQPAVAAVRDVDEFGRDVKSRHVIQRDRRRLQRKRIREQRNDDGCAITDPDLTNEDKERLQERFLALQTATTVVWNELDTDYTVLQYMIDVFGEWHAKYPKEYEQCYAGLSLADLASVFVQSELCGTAHEDLWSASSTMHRHENESIRRPEWISTIQTAISKHLMDMASVDRLLEKAIFPVIERLLEQKGINVLSHHQVQAWGRLLEATESIAESPFDLKSVVKVRQLIESYIQERLDEIAVPMLLSATTTRVSTTENDEIEEAIKDATIGQLHRMGTIVSNIVRFLLPSKADSLGLAKIVLDFVSHKFLYALSSILRESQSVVATETSPVVLLQQLYASLQQTGWLERPELMMQTAPLRAAMGAYTGAS